MRISHLLQILIIVPKIGHFGDVLTVTINFLLLLFIQDCCHRQQLKTEFVIISSVILCNSLSWPCTVD